MCDPIEVDKFLPRIPEYIEQITFLPIGESETAVISIPVVSFCTFYTHVCMHRTQQSLSHLCYPFAISHIHLTGSSLRSPGTTVQAGKMTSIGIHEGISAIFGASNTESQVESTIIWRRYECDRINANLITIRYQTEFGSWTYLMYIPFLFSPSRECQLLSLGLFPERTLSLVINSSALTDSGAIDRRHRSRPR